TVVGVAGAVTTSSIEAGAAPHLYVPLAQRPSWTLSIVLRSRLPEATLNDAARAAVRAVDPGQPLFAPATMDEIVGGAVAQRRFTTMVLVAFAATALGLAAIGIYGVVAFATSLRAHEIAIRMSLGARDRDVVGLMLRQGLTPVAAGVVLGLAGALAA